MRYCILLLFLCWQWVGAQELPDHDIHVFEFSEGRFVNPQVVSALEGYDNQPQFSSDSQGVYFTREQAGNTDIWWWTSEGGPSRLVATPLGEYSPTVLPSGAGLSTVRVEADQKQRLWKYRSRHGFELLFPKVEPIGYHAWAEDYIGLFILGEPHSFQVLNLETRRLVKVAENIGRCLQKVPNEEVFSITLEREGRHRLVRYSPKTGKVDQGRLLPKNSQDYVWLDKNTLITSTGSQLLKGDWSGDRSWERMDAPVGFQGISRLAISPDRRRLAVVHLKNGWLW